MKLKTQFVIALMGMVSLASAQTVVTLGTFGFSRVAEPAGFHIAGMQFDNTTNTPQTVYGDTLPSGSKVYSWNGSGYSSATYGPVFVPGTGTVTKWNADLDLGNGDGYWVEAPGVVASTLSGDVPLDDSITNSIVAGFQLCSYPYPVDRVVTNLGFSPVSGDKIYVWDGSGYSSSSYGSVFVPGTGTVIKWNNETLSIATGEGFWYESNANTNWIASRPFILN